MTAFDPEIYLMVFRLKIDGRTEINKDILIIGIDFETVLSPYKTPQVWC